MALLRPPVTYTYYLAYFIWGVSVSLTRLGHPSPAVGQHVKLCISMMKMAYFFESGLP